ncbi:hypothetical protein DL98DRAFT_632743 [Cadophora sp. DSE1049]|nr:hypothetical protein DL98DRAFT_632743 [Cadophora sp. DSE1049]
MKSAMLQMDGYLQAGNIPQNLAAIQEIFGFGTPIKSVADVLVVAIDIENVGWKGQIPPYFQIGLCVLDTRHLMSYSSTFNETDAVIVSHSFCVGPEKYRATVSNQFRFGETKMIRRAEVSATIENIMSGRDYALVFHDRKEDIRFLEAMQVGLNPTYFIDTQQAAKEVLGVHHNTNLRTLVEIVQCPKEQLTKLA